MGFDGNHTGYSVDSLDVFLWVLLTAGTITFPAAVFTICCLKQKWKVQKLEQEYLYADPSKKKNLERGFLGPYAESKENVTDEIRPETRIPEIIIQPNSNYGLNNKVRFKDDLSANGVQVKQQDFNTDSGELETNDLRGLKNAVNYFGKNLANKRQNMSNRSNNSANQQQAPSQPNPYVQNPTQQSNESNDQSVFYSSATNIGQNNPVVYTTADAYPQIGIQGTLSQDSNLVPENIYSQVVPQNRVQNVDKYSNSQDGFYNDDDPVYMNTPYNGDEEQYDQYSEDNTRNYN